MVIGTIFLTLITIQKMDLGFIAVTWNYLLSVQQQPEKPAEMLGAIRRILRICKKLSFCFYIKPR